VYGKYFSFAPPARSDVEVARLPKDALVEIDLTHWRRNSVVVQSDCHPEQAFFAQRRIWASRAKSVAFFCDAIIARLLTSYQAAPLPGIPENWRTYCFKTFS